MNKNLSSCNFCKEDFAEQYLHLHLYLKNEFIWIKTYLSSCKFCKEKFAKQYLHLHLYWVGQVIRCFTFCQKVCLMVGQVIRCKTLLITWPTISQKCRSDYALYRIVQLYCKISFQILLWTDEQMFIQKSVLTISFMFVCVFCL